MIYMLLKQSSIFSKKNLNQAKGDKLKSFTAAVKGYKGKAENSMTAANVLKDMAQAAAIVKHHNEDNKTCVADSLLNLCNYGEYTTGAKLQEFFNAIYKNKNDYNKLTDTSTIANLLEQTPNGIVGETDVGCFP